jgi:hypothetical protein
MGEKIEATFTIDSWEERTLEEFDGGRRITHASVRKSYHGAIQGHGVLEYVMAYGDDGSARFVGMERVVGRLKGRSGSFVLRHSGRFEGGVAKANLRVVPQSATGDLVGLGGKGKFALSHDQEYSLSLEYEFE